MNCIVTAGPTFEPLDEVRRLTNFSTGRLGVELANFLTGHGHDIALLLSQQATWPGPRQARRIESFGTTSDLNGRLQQFAGEPIDAVFHAAAVSDFKFGKVWQRSPQGVLSEVSASKIPTREERLLVELVPTVKIIASLRTWFPRACLVGWKYEVDGDRASTLAKAGSQTVECRTDACVANGPAYGDGFGLVTVQGQRQHLADTKELFTALEALAVRA